MDNERRKMIFGEEVVIKSDKELDKLKQFRTNFLNDVSDDSSNDLMVISRMGVRVGVMSELFTAVLTKVEKDHPIEANIMFNCKEIKEILLLVHKIHVEYRQLLTRMEII